MTAAAHPLLRLSGSALLVAAFLAAAGTAAVEPRAAQGPLAPAGVWTGTAVGGAVQTRHRDDGRVVMDDRQIYNGRLTFSFRVLRDGRIQGSGRGRYRAADWHMEGTNGGAGPGRYRFLVAARDPSGNASRAKVITVGTRK